MDSQFLKSLISVVDTGSIAEAAKLEHRTPAAISQRIKALETEFGFDLLCRKGHSANPTAACMKILPRARRIVDEMSLIVGDASTQGFLGALRIGVISSELTPAFVSILRTLGCHEPHLYLTLLEDTPRILYNELIAGNLDLAIMDQPNCALPPLIQSIPLHKEELCLITQRAINEPIADALLANRYIEYIPDRFSNNIAKDYLADLGIVIHPSCGTSSLDAVSMLVRDGVGVSLVPHWSGLNGKLYGCTLTKVGNPKYMRNIVMLHSVTGDMSRIAHKVASLMEV